MEFKTTDGSIIYSANVIQTDVKFKDKKHIEYAKAKIDGDRKWHRIDKSSEKAFANFAMTLQSRFMNELGIDNFHGTVYHVNTDNVCEDYMPPEPSTKKNPIIEVVHF